MNENRPIRRKGYYRALKRLEPWALKIEELKDKSPLQYLFALTYGVHIHNLIPTQNPFFSSLPKEDFTGFFHQPVILGLKPLNKK